MCETPDHFPEDSFIIEFLNKIEEIIDHDGSNYQIRFFRDQAHINSNAHYPKNSAVGDALGRVLMSLKIIYNDPNNNNECNIFDSNNNKADYAARAILSITQYFVEKNEILSFLLGIPTVNQFRFRIYHIVLDVIAHSFIDHLIEKKNCLQVLKERINKIEEEVQEFVLQNTSPKEFFHNQIH